MPEISRIHDSKFDSGSDEPVLANGAQVRLRLLGTDDKAALARGFERLSPEARYRRFLSSKKHLTADELRFFTELDGVNHAAVAAFELSKGNGGDRRAGDVEGDVEGDVVGVARFVRIIDNADVAEVAITVIDELQGLGLGRLLLVRLVQLASVWGISHFRFYFLSENNQIRRFIKRLCWHVTFSNDGQLIAAECPLSGPDAVQNNALELLGLLASGSVATPLALSLVSSEIWWREVFMANSYSRRHRQFVKSATASPPAERG